MKGDIQRILERIRDARNRGEGVTLGTYETSVLGLYLNELKVLENACQRGLTTENVLKRLAAMF